MSPDLSIMDAPPPYSPHDPFTPLTPASSTSSESNMTLLPVRPSLRGGYLRPAEESEEPSFSSAAGYFQERPFTGPLPSPLIVHNPCITPLTTREDLGLPVSFDQWLARDVNFQDWATFTNYILAELHVYPDDKDTEHGKTFSPEDLHIRQGKVADVVGDWNEGFFGPRRIKISPRYNMAPLARFTSPSSPTLSLPATCPPHQAEGFHYPQTHAHGVMNHHHSGPYQRVTHPWHGREQAGSFPGGSYSIPRPNFQVSGQSGYVSGVGGCVVPRPWSGPSVHVPHHHHVGMYDSHHSHEGERRGRGRGRGKYRRRDSSTSSSSSSSSSSSDSSISSISSDELEGANVNDIRQSLAAFRLDPTKKKHIHTAVRQLHSELRAHKRESRGEGKERSREAKAEFRNQKRAIKSEVRTLLREARTMKRDEKRQQKAEKKAIKAERRARKRTSKNGGRSRSLKREDTRGPNSPVESSFRREPRDNLSLFDHSRNVLAQSSGVLDAREVELETKSVGQQDKVMWQSGLSTEKQNEMEEESMNEIQRDSQKRNPEKSDSKEQFERLAETRQVEGRERGAEARKARLDRENEARHRLLAQQAEMRDKQLELAARQRERQADNRNRQLEQAGRQREQQAELRNQQLEQATKQRERESERRAKNVRFASSSRQSDEDRCARELEQAAQRMEHEAEMTRREAERLRRGAAQRQQGVSPVIGASVLPGPSSMPGAFPGGAEYGTDQTRGAAAQAEASMRGLGNWGEEFGRNMGQWGENFGRSMENMGRNLERSLR